jgi:hypothetical protein
VRKARRSSLARLPLSTLVLCTVLQLAPLAARAQPVAFGIRAGSTGIGPELSLDLAPQIALRVPTGFYSYGTTYTKTGIHYDATLELRNALLLADWHPGGGSFRVSVGGGWDGNRLKVTAPVSELVRRYRPDIAPLVPASAGTIRGDAKGSSFAPYAGLGWGQPFRGGRWAVTFDVGAIHQGAPRVNLAADLNLGVPIPASAQPIVDAAIADEERRLEHELDSYRWYPVVALGITFRP